MPRYARIVLPGWPHHVVQRGNQRQVVFFSDDDRQRYLQLLAKHFAAYHVAMLGFCLMDNHTHLVVVPKEVDSLARGVGRAHRDFARWQNIQCDRVGHLWQNRYFSCPVEEERAWQVLSYVELNPVRAGLVANAWDWHWSSARSHADGIDRTGLLDMRPWQKHFDGERWMRFIERAALDRYTAVGIRMATSTGRLFGSEQTIDQIEDQLGTPIRGTG